MNAGDHVEDFLPAYALGSLDREEHGLVRRHLGRCRSCRASLAKYEETVDCLSLGTPFAAPSADLKQRLLRDLTEESPSAGGRWRRWWKAFWTVPRIAPGWAAATSLALVLAAVMAAGLWQRNENLPGLRSRVVTLTASDSLSGIRGILIFDIREPEATLVVEGMPVLEDDRQYQLWLIRDGRRTSGGVFSVSPRGYRTLLVTDSEPLGSYQACGITVEPAGGSPGPTGPRVLAGSF